MRLPNGGWTRRRPQVIVYVRLKGALRVNTSPMTSHRLLTLSPDHEPLWVRLYLHQIGEKWAAMLLADEEPPPKPGEVKGLAFFRATAEEAEQAVKVYLGRAEPTS